MMKTPITVLQEMMIKLNELPEYECISQSGPQHQVIFEYRCVAHGVAVTGQARSKKEAKQEAARHMLLQLHAKGLPVPPPFASTLTPCSPSFTAFSAKSSPTEAKVPALDSSAEPGGVGPGVAKPGAVLDASSYVALLRELCEEYRLGEVKYELVGDTGPPHQRRFTVRADLGLHQRTATATTKKSARQRAAKELYSYLRENLARLTTDFVEEEALQRAQEKQRQRAHERSGMDAALARYAEHVDRVEPGTVRPHLGQQISEYHLGLLAQLDDEARERGKVALQELDERKIKDDQSMVELQALCEALGLRVETESLPPSVSVVRVVPSTPPLAFAGFTEQHAVHQAIRYVRQAFCEYSVG